MRHPIYRLKGGALPARVALHELYKISTQTFQARQHFRMLSLVQHCIQKYEVKGSRFKSGL